MRVIGHRGSGCQYPENTVRACEHALTLGVDAIEVDLLRSKDGRIVVRHDDLIEQHGTWHFVQELTLEELQRIDLGQDQRIPTVEEVLDQLYGRVELLLDIKAFGLAQPLAALLQQRQMVSGVHVTSFLHEEVYAVQAQCPAIRRSITLAAMPVSLLDVMRQSPARTVNLFRGYLNQHIVQQLRDMDVAVCAYPVTVPREADLFATWGVDGIFVPNPAVMQSLRTRPSA